MRAVEPAGLVFDLSSERFYQDPHRTFERMREEAPVYYDPDGDFYALTRHRDVMAAYRDYTTYSSAGGLDLEMMRAGQKPPKMILFMDPPEHGRMRALVKNAFTPSAIVRQRTVVEQVVRRFLQAIERPEFDLVADFAALFPVEVVSSILGVPEESRHQVRMWSDEITRFQPGQPGRNDVANRAILELFTFYCEMVQARRTSLTDDMISTLVAAEVLDDDGNHSQLDDFEIASFAMMLGAAGAVTVTKLMGSLIALLGLHSDQWHQLRKNRAKIRNAIEETLRFEGPILYNLRRTTKPVVLHGVTIPPDKPVLLCTASANRDPDVFPEPDRFDIDRNVSTAQSLGMGYGIHNCLGAALARMEAAIALDQLLDFMPSYQIRWEGSARVHSSNESGWSQLPLRVLR